MEDDRERVRQDEPAGAHGTENGVFAIEDYLNFVARPARITVWDGELEETTYATFGVAWLRPGG